MILTFLARIGSINEFTGAILANLFEVLTLKESTENEYVMRGITSLLIFQS